MSGNSASLPEGIDTIAVAVPDNVGRLMGKRVAASRWPLIIIDGLPMPNFHLVTGIDNEPQPGFRVTGLHTGFGNGMLRPDVTTLRRLPWEPATALVIADAYHSSDELVEEAPRSILRRQINRLEGLGYRAGFASELEFYLFRTSYARAAESRYSQLPRSYHRHGDNDLLVAGFDEPLIGEIRRAMTEAGIVVELSQGEGGPGQHELALEWTTPLEMADRHVIYKHGVKAMAHDRDCAATFMAKVSDDEPGSSCHVHLSLTNLEGAQAFGTGPHQLTAFGSGFLAGLLEFAPELMLLHAPFQNSYRRLRPGSWAPANVTWGHDDRTCLIRTVGTDEGFRLEFRLPGADVNPYLSYSAILAAGLAGVERGLQPAEPVLGNAYGRPDAPALPGSLAEAVEAFAHSEVAVTAFGPDVHEHLTTLGRLEAEASRWIVTDWELKRGFESA